MVKLTNRERFLRLMNYEPIDRLPVLAVEPYESEAIRRWRGEGLPAGADPVDFLGMSRLVEIPINFGPLPPFEPIRVSEDASYYVEQSDMGALVRRSKDNPTMFYGHIDHPVKTRADWEQYKLRFQAATPGRLPANWTAELLPRLRASSDPVCLTLFPFFFRVGFYSMGMARFLSAFHEEPDLLHDMFAYLGAFTIANVRAVLDVLTPDIVRFGEDLAGKNGPLISPKIYAEFWYPYQDPIIRLLQERGVPVICQWSAGQFGQLLPGMLEHGFNCISPLEGMAGMDAVQLRARFGRPLRLAGNIPKEAVIAGPAAIDHTIDRLMPLICEGGFLPALDDMAAPDMPFAHYRWMIERLQGLRLN
jgi:hypothetical protein